MIGTHSLEEIMTMNIDPQKHNVMRCSYFYNHKLDKEQFKSFSKQTYNIYDGLKTYY